jgi:hypothetical protein
VYFSRSTREERPDSHRLIGGVKPGYLPALAKSLLLVAATVATQPLLSTAHAADGKPTVANYRWDLAQQLLSYKTGILAAVGSGNPAVGLIWTIAVGVTNLTRKYDGNEVEFTAKEISHNWIIQPVRYQYRVPFTETSATQEVDETAAWKSGIVERALSGVKTETKIQHGQNELYIFDLAGVQLAPAPVPKMNN